MKLLLIDIETAPNKVYCWGLWDQNIAINQVEEAGYTLCYSAKWYGKTETLFDSLQQSSMKKMIKSVHKLLEEADAVIHYNGRRFDIPTLNKEFILLGLDPPSGYKEIDLLQVARRKFKFQSNKLDYVAQSLGIGSKVKHKGMDLWRGCMNNDTACWKQMERYNKQDVQLLEKVYKRMLPWIQSHPNYGLYSDSDRPVCRNCGSSQVIKKGTEYTAVGKYQRYKCRKCRTYLRGSILQNTSEERKKLLR
jgi:DNA polymerase elongation subunit (family B)